MICQWINKVSISPFTLPFMGINRFLLENILRNRFLVKSFLKNFKSRQMEWGLSRFMLQFHCLYLLTGCLVPVVVWRKKIPYTHRGIRKKEVSIDKSLFLSLSGHKDIFRTGKKSVSRQGRQCTPMLRPGRQRGQAASSGLSVLQDKEVSKK